MLKRAARPPRWVLPAARSQIRRRDPCRAKAGTVLWRHQSPGDDVRDLGPWSAEVKAPESDPTMIALAGAGNTRVGGGLL